METARVILLFAWIVGVCGLINLAPVWSRVFRHKLFVGCTLAIVLGTALFTFDWWIVKHLVVVKPDKELTLSETFGPLETTLYVNNRADDPVYSVWLKLRILTSGVSSDTVTVEIDDTEVPSKPHPFNDALAVADAKWFSGFDDHGIESVFVWFPTIPPHTTYHINIKGSSPTKSTARASIMGFTLIPTRYFNRRGQVGFEMLVPETIKARSIGLQIVKRKR